MLLAGLRGSQAEAAPLLEATIDAADAAGQGLTVTAARWMAAVLLQRPGPLRRGEGGGRAGRRGPMPGLYVSTWALPELIEAAARTGNMPSWPPDALARLAETTQPGGTDWGLGIEARSRALVSEGQAAEGLYREAIDRLGRTQLRPELARAHLLYGEWLRREDRRSTPGSSCAPPTACLTR